MTFLKTTIAVIVAISSAGYAQAQDSGAYGGLGASAYVTSPEGAFDAELFAAEAKLGYNFNTYFGVEVQGSLGLNTDSVDLDPETVERKVDYSVAGFAVARWPVSDKFQLFARGGIHNTQVSVDVVNDIGDITSSINLTETGFAVGAGAQFNFDKKNAIRADYTYLDGTNGETLSLGYIRKF